MKTNWQLKIEDPSGETRYLELRESSITLGRGENEQIPLRDPTLLNHSARLTLNPNQEDRMGSPFWIQVPKEAPAAVLGDLQIREAHIPSQIPFKLGETRFTVMKKAVQSTLPAFPSGCRPWFTQSESGHKTLWTAKKAASTPLSVYLAGETGTGKEVLSHLIHAWSDRKSGPFVPLHCGALPQSLAESELFGHVKGAFTGAIQHRTGALMQAHGGTLFLDEIGDLPLDMQVKLLRFLEDGEIRPVGADRPSHANVRLICATHHPLEQLVEEGKFRQDLYYRLASITVFIPPLRSRLDDIELLAGKFASELNQSLSPRAVLRLKAHAWPGNVRELRHAIERATGFSSPFSTVLNEEAFEFLLTPRNLNQSPALELGASVLTLKEMERALVIKVLRITDGNRAKAARTLGVARSTLFEMLKRHKIKGPKNREYRV